MKALTLRAVAALSIAFVAAAPSLAQAGTWRLTAVVTHVDEGFSAPSFAPLGSTLTVDYEIDESAITAEGPVRNGKPLAFGTVGQSISFNGGRAADAEGDMINIEILKALNVVIDPNETEGMVFASLNVRGRERATTGGELLSLMSTRLKENPSHSDYRMDFSNGTANWSVHAQPVSLSAVPEAGAVTMSLGGMAVAGMMAALRRRRA